MFLPSEAIYAELHARLPDVVREGFAARVWIVSPTTCMATLNTMRAILKDARMREQAGAIRRELGLLFQDVDNFSRETARNIKRGNLFRCAWRELDIHLVRAGTQWLTGGNCGSENQCESLHVGNDIPYI